MGKVGRGGKEKEGVPRKKDRRYSGEPAIRHSLGSPKGRLSSTSACSSREWKNEDRIPKKGPQWKEDGGRLTERWTNQKAY